MTTSRRVVVYLPGRSLGGAERLARTIADGLGARGWQPTIVCADREVGRALAQEGARVTVLGTGSRGGLPGLAREIAALSGLLRRTRPAVVHAHLGWPAAGAGAVLAALLARTPLVMTLHLWVAPSRRVRWRWRLIGPAVRRWIAVSEGIAHHLRETLGVPAGRVEVVPNGVDIGALRTRPAEADDVRAELGTPLVVAVAALRGQKRLDRLVRAAAQLPEVTVAVAGEGPERAALEKLAARLGVAERVRLLGERRDVVALLHAADVVALPSDSEGLPLAVLEAMAAGRAIVATDVEGTREAIVDGTTGVLVAADDGADLAGAIRALLDDPHRASRLGVQAAAVAAERFDRARMLDRVEAVLGSVVEGEASGSEAVARVEDGWRAADWRFIVGLSRVERAIVTDPALEPVVRSVADRVEVLEGDGRRPPVATSPARLVVTATASPGLDRLVAPGGSLVVIRGSSRRPRRRPDPRPGAGSIRVSGRWIAWPGSRVARWVRDDPAALVRHRRDTRPAGIGRRRLESLAWPVRRRLGLLPDVTVATSGPATTTAFIELLGGQPAVLLVGGRRVENKVVAIAAGRPNGDGRIVKTVRAPSLNDRLEREAQVLAGLGGSGLGPAAGVPALLDRALLEDGSSALAETGLSGRRASGIARRRGFEAVAEPGVAWLASLGAATRRPAGDAARRERASAVLDRFVGLYDGLVRVDSALRDEILDRLDALPVVAEHRDTAPWNLIVRDDGSIAAADWESAELDGWPGLDLWYFLAWLAFDVAGARSVRRQFEIHASLRERGSRVGRVAAQLVDRYAEVVDVPARDLRAVEPFAWAIHAIAEGERLLADRPSGRRAEVLAAGLHHRLWSASLAPA